MPVPKFSFSAKLPSFQDSRFPFALLFCGSCCYDVSNSTRRTRTLSGLDGHVAARYRITRLRAFTPLPILHICTHYTTTPAFSTTMLLTRSAALNSITNTDQLVGPAILLLFIIRTTSHAKRAWSMPRDALVRHRTLYSTVMLFDVLAPPLVLDTWFAFFFFFFFFFFCVHGLPWPDRLLGWDCGFSMPT